MMQSTTASAKVHYSCRLCGSASYRSVFDRNASGAIHATRTYRCSGCALTFRDPKEWRAMPLRAAGAA